jgi:hypothetical protein
MPYNASQIVALACSIAKCPNFTSQAGTFLNVILEDLCQTYDFALARGVFSFSFNSATGTGSGPYTLPTDYLRTPRDDDEFFTITGVPYRMTPIDYEEYLALPQTSGFQDYPQMFAVNVSTLQTLGYMTEYFWPPPSGSYPVTQLYQKQMTAITTPETSTTVPWFPNQNYLITRLAGELMRITNDDRMQAFLSDSEEAHPDGAGSILRRYLKMKDDNTNRAKTVRLDKRRFGRAFNSLPSTKTIGW